MLRSQYAGSLYSEVIVRFLPPLKVVGFLALLFVKAVYDDAVNYAVVRNTLLFPKEQLLEHNENN